MILLDTLAILTCIIARLFCFLHTLHCGSRYRFLCQVDLLSSLHFKIGLWPNAWHGSARSKGLPSKIWLTKRMVGLQSVIFCLPSKNIHESKGTNQKGGTMQTFMDYHYDYATTIYYSQGHWVIHVILNFKSLTWSTDSDPPFFGLLMAQTASSPCLKKSSKKYGRRELQQ